MDDGKEYPVDVLICATGFDTTFKPRFPLVGRNDVDLAHQWAQEPRSYLGLAAHNFPNYFMYLGPNCPIANGPIIFSIELQGTYIAEFMNRWQKEGIRTFDPKKEAVDEFQDQKDIFMKSTVWESHCQSWYKNPQSGKITAVWPGSTFHYAETLAQPRYDDYDVTYTGNNRFAYLGNGFSQIELNPKEDLAYYIRDEDKGEPLFKSTMSTVNIKDAYDMIYKLHDSPF